MQRKYRGFRKREIKKRRIMIIISMFIITFLFASGYAAFSSNISLNAKGNVKEGSRVIKSWSSYNINGIWALDTPDFHNDEYREKIVTITFLDNTKISSDVVISWDVSADGKGRVKAWITKNEEDNSKYNLFIGAKNGVIANEDSSSLFSGFSNVKKIEFNNNIDTSNVTSMWDMFYNCSSIEQLDVSSFDTSNVINMRSVFLNTKKLKSIDLSNFDTSKVTNMQQMFQGNNSLIEVNLSSFNTSNVITMWRLFRDCINLTTIYTSNNFVTTNVTNSNDMFYGDISLIGGNGTIFDESYIDKTYARIDKEGQKGYFTLKTNE